MRDEFSKKVKTIAAQRVVYRCSFPGCTRLTIGPGKESNVQVISVGEAAHIYSASPKGPRNNPNFSVDERSSIENAIWMCKTHARLIDVNEASFSAETLKNGKLKQKTTSMDCWKLYRKSSSMNLLL